MDRLSPEGYRNNYGGEGDDIDDDNTEDVVDRVGTGSPNRPGKFSLTGPHYRAKTSIYHDILVAGYNSRYGHPRFALEITKFDLLPKTFVSSDLKNI